MIGRTSPLGAVELPSPAVARGGVTQAALPAAARPLRAPPGPPSPGGVSESDLPAIGGALPGFGERDLPSLDDDLPALSDELPSLGGPGLGGRAQPPSFGAELPSLSGDLPSLGGDLPSLGGNLPALGGELPVIGGTLPDVGGRAAPPRRVSDELDFGELGQEAPPESRGSLGPPRAPSLPGFSAVAATLSAPATPVPSARQAPAPEEATASAGAAAFDEGDDASFEPPQAPEGPAPAAIERQSGGGTAYGEVNLGDDSEGQALESDEMEFGRIPQEGRSAPADALGQAERGRAGAVVGGEPLVGVPPRPRKWLRVVIGGVALGAIAGAALALVPDVGPFGYYWISDQLKAEEYRQLLQHTLEQARAELGQDTFQAALRAQQLVDGQREGARRVKALGALGAYVTYVREVRFGSDPEASARAQVLLSELGGHPETAFLELARAAEAAAGGRFGDARQSLTALLARTPDDQDAANLLGEVELRSGDATAALAAWQRAVSLQRSPLTLFGLARAQAAAGAAPEAETTLKELLTQSAGHVGARILQARLSWRQHRDEAKALELLGGVLKDVSLASPLELAEAQTLLGDLHLERSRYSHAEQAYSEALKIDSRAMAALLGLGTALYRAGRYSESLARFQAAAQVLPEDLAAQVGVARSMIALERLQDAKTLLEQLRGKHPKAAEVAYWFGKVQEALGNRAEAEAAYRSAVELGQASPQIMDAYVALALLQNQRGEAEVAKQTLAKAKELLPDSPAIHKALGELALIQGRYSDALVELKRSLELDPEDVGVRFKLGSALRRNRDFDEAAKAFDQVAAVDKDYPGLALERGLLFEAAGRTEEALKAYEGALSKAPNDTDLMLRVGCGRASTGNGTQAEELLRKVLVQRPQSAETHHCLGRAMLATGTNLAEAQRELQRAAELDANRAEYHLYVGWAANEAGRVQEAERALERALELDQGLADAYWQRGVLKYRTGAVRDAVADLKRALELNPTRAEAHAALADSYYDLGREADSMGEWQLAVAALPNNASWRFRYGKLLAANRRAADAVAQLQRALELAAPLTPQPRWLPEANYLLARSMGQRAEAVPHWQYFLKHGPKDSPYRSEAKKALAALGQPSDED